MHYYEKSLLEAVADSQTPTGDKKSPLDYAIELLIAVNRMHTGEAFRDKKPRAHCDIKPANVRVDNNGKVHIIDFGLAQETNLEQEHKTSNGTPRYLPSDQPVPLESYTIKTTPNYYFDDTIAALRTITGVEYTYNNNKFLDGIFSKEFLVNLPKEIKDLLDTTTIDTCKEKYKNGQFNLPYIITKLIQYSLQDKNESFIAQHIKNNPELLKYIKDKDIIIKAIKGKGCSFKDIPDEFKKDESVILAAVSVEPEVWDSIDVSLKEQLKNRLPSEEKSVDLC